MDRTSCIPITSGLVAPLVPMVFRLLKKEDFNTLRCEYGKNYASEVYRTSNADYASLFNILSEKRMPQVAEQIFLELKSEGFAFDVSSVSNLMLCYAENGFLLKARMIWDDLMEEGMPPIKVEVVTKLFNSYAKEGLFEEIVGIIDELRFRGLDYLFPEVYSSAVSCLGSQGRLDLMKLVVGMMISHGYPVDSRTGSAYVKYYSLYGSLGAMEAAHVLMKQSSCLIQEDGIRAMAFAYIKEKEFYMLGEFLRNVGLRRRDCGNLLWNLLLLSYAANFKMKSLQREFLKMLDAGFDPDVTTFNIRMIAFAKMSLLWDLHLSIEHMNNKDIVPDLVTYGCIVDSYMDRRLGRNLSFALQKMNTSESPSMKTDPFVFDVLGKGGFHLSAEAFMEYSSYGKWSYRKLVAVYLKKYYRRNQIFWNY